MTITDLDWKLRRDNGRLVLAAAAQVIIVPETPTVPDVVLTFEQELRAWINSEAWTWISSNPVSGTTDLIATASIEWPDKSAGVYTLLTTNTTYGQWDSRRLTHVNSSKSITQTVKSRNGATVTGYTLTIT